MSTLENPDRESAETDRHSHDERLLHEKAIEGTRLGLLPDHAPTRVWTGNGAGDPCGLCGKRIGRGKVEYQVLDRADRVFLFHLRCRAIWEDAISAKRSGSTQR
jgi:hypothetical protein